MGNETTGTWLCALCGGTIPVCSGVIPSQSSAGYVPAPWQPPPCPKCGNEDIRISYTGSMERLTLTCRRCGYIYFRPCLDAKESEDGKHPA